MAWNAGRTVVPLRAARLGMVAARPARARAGGRQLVLRRQQLLLGGLALARAGPEEGDGVPWRLAERSRKTPKGSRDTGIFA